MIDQSFVLVPVPVAQLEAVLAVVRATTTQRPTSPEFHAPQGSSVAQDVNAEVADRIFKGLTYAHLPDNYRRLLKAWLDCPVGQWISVSDLRKTLGADSGEVRAWVSKLSARMKRSAKASDLEGKRTPLYVLVDIDYDDTNSSRYRLTAAGRDAVGRYLRRG